MIDQEVEILDIPALAEGQGALLDMHSLLNVLNVLRGELAIVGLELADNPDLLADALRRCDEIRGALADRDATLRQVARVPEHTRAILDCMTAAAGHPSATRPAYLESAANIANVLTILGVRAQEILARAQAPDEWIQTPVSDLQNDLRSVFRAIEKNSHGRYRILYNLAAKETADYYVDLNVESLDGWRIHLPIVFKDVIRDLLANARKYTPPGGTINAGLLETADRLSFSVQDTGRGIPPDELETVVHFGKRGSNTGDVRTLGGGFGLTKAFLVTKRFGGRFRIGSVLGKGTRVRIDLPRPARLRPPA